MGEELEAVLLTDSVLKRKKIVGMLSEYDSESIVLTTSKGDVTVRRSEIKTLKPYVDLKKLK